MSRSWNRWCATPPRLRGSRRAWRPGSRRREFFLARYLAMSSTLEDKAGLHVAIIMDGNGRWAEHRGLPRSAGHRAGMRALSAIVEAAPALAISTLTLFAFSSDNWKRPPQEVAALMGLMGTYLRREARRVLESGVR